VQQTALMTRFFILFCTVLGCFEVYFAQNITFERGHDSRFDTTFSGEDLYMHHSIPIFHAIISVLNCASILPGVVQNGSHCFELFLGVF